MTVLVTQELPGVDREMVEAVGKAMNVYDDPPDGLILHIAREIPGGVSVVDVWESKEDFDHFRTGRLDPTVAKLVAEMGAEPMALPEFEVYETFDLVHQH